MASMIHRLQRMIQDVNRASDIDHALELIARGLIEDLQAEACTIYLVDTEHRDTLILKECQGLNRSIIGNVKRKVGQGIIGMVAARAEPVNLLQADQHKEFILIPDSGEEVMPVYLGVPVIAHREVLGVIAIQRGENPFDTDDEAFLTTLAAQLATSMEQAESQGRFKLIGQQKVESVTHLLKGVAGTPGMSIGQALVLNREVTLTAVTDKRTDDPESEIDSFLQAVKKVQEDLNSQANHLRKVLSEEECALFVAYAQMLNSGSLIDDTIALIKDGNWAPSSWRDTVEDHAHVFEKMDDEYLAERANDIRDLGRRVLRKLMLEQSTYIEFPEKTVLVGDEITATDLADVPSECLCAIVSAHGSASSHVAILAHALGIPAVMGISNLPLKQMDGLLTIVDGYQGSVFIDPNKPLLKEYRTYLKEEQAIEKDLLSLKSEPAVTRDNKAVTLFVNSGLMSDLTPSLHSGAEGVGLYRTEIPFQIRDRFPSEEEQFQIYRNVLETFSGKPVVLRTLDVGGDKPLSYFPIKEDNPFLGWRGVRITLDHPEIFLTQVRAMIRANVGKNNLHILLPMISGATEIDESMLLIQQVFDELSEEIDAKVEMPKIGAMIEVPSAVYQIKQICSRVDFISIGTNDLTQYLLAVDRNNENVAGLFSSLHPAVLNAMSHVLQGANESGRPVSVCGEMAGDPLGVMVLLGMGIENLSMSVGSLLRAKKVIKSFQMSELQSLYRQASEMSDPLPVKKLYETALDEVGLGGLIRAGK